MADETICIFALVSLKLIQGVFQGVDALLKQGQRCRKPLCLQDFQGDA